VRKGLLSHDLTAALLCPNIAASHLLLRDNSTSGVTCHIHMHWSCHFWGLAQA
jgi:hypothetical protein